MQCCYLISGPFHSFFDIPIPSTTMASPRTMNIHPTDPPHPDLLFPDLPDIEEDLPLFAPVASTSQQGASQWSIHQAGGDIVRSRDKGKGKLVDFEPVDDETRRNASESTSRAALGRILDGSAEPLVSPLGAKAIASVTGAVMTSLLSTSYLLITWNQLVTNALSQ
jgi:hypothetical protein